MSHKLFCSFFVLILIIGLMTIQAPQPVYAAGPWFVSITGDDNNDCLSPATPCATINGAIGKATDGDTINVASGTYTGIGSLVTVVVVNKNLNISGGWNDSFSNQNSFSTIDGQNYGGIDVYGNVIVNIEWFNIVNSNFYPGVIVEGTTSNTLTLNNVSISNNTAGYGGGIYNGGNLTLNNSIISNNSATYSGGGIFNEGTLILNNSTISNNSASHFGSNGGGIWNGYNSTVILNNSTVNGNTVAISGCGGDGAGGGIFIADDNTSVAILNNSTVSNNQACNSGGGIFSRGILTLNNSTVSKNSVTDLTGNGGGISVENSVTMQNTIIAGNTVTQDPFGRPDCDARFGATSQTVINSLGYNIIGNSYGCMMTVAEGDLLDVDPLLGPLIAFSGIPSYHPLLSGSPAIDAGNPAGCTDQDGNLLTTDQRGVARPQGAACDIGAFELEIASPVKEVTIDIKPGSQSNPINRKSSGKIPVVILSTPDFDAPSEIDKASLTFGSTGDEASLAFCNKGAEDVNSDGLLDQVCHFYTKKTGFQKGDTKGILKGLTVDGTSIEGNDLVRIVR